MVPKKLARRQKFREIIFTVYKFTGGSGKIRELTRVVFKNVFLL